MLVRIFCASVCGHVPGIPFEKVKTYFFSHVMTKGAIDPIIKLITFS